MKKIVYCPYCGHIYLVGWRAVKDLEQCHYCNTKTDFAETSNSEEYYLKKAEELFGRGNHFLKYGDIAFEEEISKNPLFTQEIKKVEEQRKKEISEETSRRMEYLHEVEKRNNQPKCPLCNSPNIKRISTLNRTASIFTFGLASSKIGKQFECLNCKYKF